LLNGEQFHVTKSVGDVSNSFSRGVEIEKAMKRTSAPWVAQKMGRSESGEKKGEKEQATSFPWLFPLPNFKWKSPGNKVEKQGREIRKNTFFASIFSPCSSFSPARSWFRSLCLLFYSLYHYPNVKTDLQSISCTFPGDPG